MDALSESRSVPIKNRFLPDIGYDVRHNENGDSKGHVVENRHEWNRDDRSTGAGGTFQYAAERKSNGDIQDACIHNQASLLVVFRVFNSR